MFLHTLLCRQPLTPQYRILIRIYKPQIPQLNLYIFLCFCIQLCFFFQGSNFKKCFQQAITLLYGRFRRSQQCCVQRMCVQQYVCVYAKYTLCVHTAVRPRNIPRNINRMTTGCCWGVILFRNTKYHISRQHRAVRYLKKNQSAPRLSEHPPVRACINDVRKIKIGKNQNQNWVLIGRGSKPPDYASLFFGNRCQTKEVPRDFGGVHLIEGFPNATRQRPEHSRVTTAARRQTAPPHNTHNFCWHGPRQRSHGEGNR